MTLFLAVLLLSQFGFSWPWYIAAGALWLLHLHLHSLDKKVGL